MSYLDDPVFQSVEGIRAQGVVPGSGPSGLGSAMDPATLSSLTGGGEGAFTGGSEGPLSRLVLKILAKEEWGRAHANYSLIESAGERGELQFSVPELMVADPSRNALVLREPRGRSLTSYLDEPFREPFAKVGHALASLHNAAIEPALALREQVVLDAAIRATQRIVRALPSMEVAMASIIERIMTMVPRFAIDEMVPLHGSFDGDAVVIDGASVGIREWDHLMSGHPHHDLAGLGAHVIDESFAGYVPMGVTRSCVRALVESYSEATGRPVPRGVFGWHLAVALIVRARSKSLRHLGADYCRRLKYLVDEADRLLDGRSRYLRTS